MASVKPKKGKTGEKPHYVVICYQGGHKWIKAGALKDAKILKKEIESLENSKRIEKLVESTAGSLWLTFSLSLSMVVTWVAA